jgi:multidrug efflux pump subunit AcrB
MSEQETRPRGVLAWFAGNRVAANILMLFFIVGGLLALVGIKIEIFPEIDTDLVTVTVPYRGGTPDDVEQGVAIKVEEAIAGIEGIKEIRSVSQEGLGTVIAELEPDADDNEVLNDIKNEVDRIDTFPDETEEPVIAKATNRVQVIIVVLSGNVPERTLKYLAEEARDELTALENISQVEIAAARPFEISIEVSEMALRKYGLSFDQVAEAVRQSSLDLPGGSVKSEGGEILIRTKAQKYVGRQFEDIVIIARNDGTKVYLDDVATVVDGFEDTDTAALFDGKRSISLHVFRVGSQGAFDVADTVEDYVQQKKLDLPAGVSIDTWIDRSMYLRSRVELLLRNAAVGLVLVFLCLTFFLDLRLAFWVTMGIPMSFLGSFVILPHMDVSVNMMSLFSFIVVLGIVVDDAIVVGEAIYAYREKGMKPLAAAVRGAKEMSAPVFLAVLTTIAAFAPLYYTGGDMGKILGVMPLVVSAVLALSLIESLLILPAHLSGGRLGGMHGPIWRVQQWVRDGLNWMIEHPYQWLLARAVRWRYLTISIAVGVLMLTLGAVHGGFIQFRFFPPVDSDYVVGSVKMPQGTPVAVTERVVHHLEESAAAVLAEMRAELGEDAPTQYRHISSVLGEQPFSRTGGGPEGGSVTADSGGHLGELIVELVPSERRDISAREMAQRWREKAGEIPGASELKFTSELFSAGEPVNFELSHRDFDTLLRASERFKQMLADYPGVVDVRDSFMPGMTEVTIEGLTPEGRTLNLTLGEVGRQLRQGFYGGEVQRVQRGRDDIRVMVRYPEDERRSIGDIEAMRIRLPDGTEVPFTTAVDLSYGRGYAAIDRADRRRVVSVIADIDETALGANSGDINKRLKTEALPKLMAEFPGLMWDTAGEDKERAESLGSLKWNFTAALLLIFALLAVQFRSYVQPAIVMAAIPFGIVGAVIGHAVMGYDLTLLSLFGIVALAGVVVNDSLIMIDLINRERGEGVPLRQVVMDAGMRRFRPILLTTLTTFFGLMPMILEESLQARFLIPMAISLGFGVLFATMITLLLIPCLYMILEDILAMFRALETAAQRAVDEDSGDDSEADPYAPRPVPGTE